MRITKQTLAASLFLAASFSPLQAFDLNDALSETLARNPALAAAKSTYEARYMEQFVTLSAMLPQVSAFATETRTDTDAENAIAAAADTDMLDSDSYGIRVTQNLFTSGKNVNDFRAKRAEIQAEEAKYKATEQQILLGAISAYLDVLRAQSVLELRNKNVDVLTNQLDAVKDRFEVGVVTRTDIAQSQAALAGAKAAAEGAQAALRTARAVYREVVGVEPANLRKPKKLPRLPRKLDRAINMARKENPDLKNAQALSASGRFASNATVGGALPSVKLTGTFSKTDNPSALLQGGEVSSSSVQLSVNVPLFMGGRSVAAVLASQDVSNALTQNVHAASNSVERQVIVAWNNVGATKAAAGSRREQIKAAELALEGVREENKLGTRTNLDVLDAEQSLLDARVGLVEAERDEQLAAYNLLAIMGRLTAKRLRIEPAKLTAE